MLTTDGPAMHGTRWFLLDTRDEMTPPGARKMVGSGLLATPCGSDRELRAGNVVSDATTMMSSSYSPTRAGSHCQSALIRQAAEVVAPRVARPTCPSIRPLR